MFPASFHVKDHSRHLGKWSPIYHIHRHRTPVFRHWNHLYQYCPTLHMSSCRDEKGRRIFLPRKALPSLPPGCLLHPCRDCRNHASQQSLFLYWRQKPLSQTSYNPVASCLIIPFLTQREGHFTSQVKWPPCSSTRSFHLCPQTPLKFP